MASAGASAADQVPTAAEEASQARQPSEALAVPQQARLTRERSAPTLTRKPGAPGGILLRGYTHREGSSLPSTPAISRQAIHNHLSASQVVMSPADLDDLSSALGGGRSASESYKPQVGDLSKPPSCLSEAMARAMAEIRSKRAVNRKTAQRHTVSVYMQATAAAFEAKNTTFASDPAVGALLHDDIILITYDKMKFFGRRTVQKKLNHGMEQMLTMAAHLSDDQFQKYGDVAEEEADAEKAAEAEAEVDQGAGRGESEGPSGEHTAGAALSSPLPAATPTVVQGNGASSMPGKSKAQGNKLSSGSGQSSLVPTAPQPPAAPEDNAPKAGAEQGQPTTQAPPPDQTPATAAAEPASGQAGQALEIVLGADHSFSVEGPEEAPGKDNTWVVTYVWRYRRSCFKITETFSFQDHKIKKLKRARA